MNTGKATRLGYGATIVLLTALAALGMLATNIYLPALPAIGVALQASAESVRLTLTVYLAAFAVCQLIAGPLADAHGRRPVLLVGLALFALATLVCALAPDIETLIAGRSLQAIGACAASVVGRAMARDLFEGAALGKALGLIMTGVAVAPGFGPLLGGLLQEAFGWRLPFFFVAGFGAAVLAATLMTLGETKPEGRRPFSPRHVLRDYGLLLGKPSFLLPALATTCAIGALFAFFAGSPALFIAQFGLSPSQYGLVSAGTVFAVFAGGYTAPRLVGRIGPLWATRFGFVALALGAALLLMPTGAPLLWPAIGAILVFLFGIGIVNPLTMAAALQPFPQHAGMAAALIGALQMAGATFGTALVNLLPLAAAQAMPTAMLLLALLGLASMLTQPKPALQSI
jgi:DHA1 family bicyclomycin/chloramphenicol resistance-like MFS transporter